jgi:hypothetical protein
MPVRLHPDKSGLTSLRLRRYRQRLRILLGGVCGGTFLRRTRTGGHADDTEQHDNRHKAA